MEWVRQEHDRGCGVAVLAMLTGQSYSRVWAEVCDLMIDGHGLNSWDVDEYLVEHGYALARVYELRRNRRPRTPWPPEPFGDRHLCTVLVNDDSPVSHYVVLDHAGRVFDPLSPDRKTLTDYYRVYSVANVVKSCLPCNNKIEQREGTE